MWGAILKFALGFITGPLTEVSNDLKEAYQARLNAANDKERIAADERIHTLEIRKTALQTAAQQDKLWGLVRLGWALPFILYNFKLIVYDKMGGWGSTDPLSPELYQIEMICLGGYFLVEGVKRFTK